MIKHTHTHVHIRRSQIRDSARRHAPSQLGASQRQRALSVRFAAAHQLCDVVVVDSQRRGVDADLSAKIQRQGSVCVCVLECDGVC